VISLAGSLLGALPASAEDVLKDTPVVRRQALYRANRHEMSPMVGFTLGEPFTNSILPGVGYTYHLLDSIAVGGDLLVGLRSNTAIADDINAKTQAQSPNFQLASSSIRFMADLNVSFAPVVGKLMAFRSLPLHYDAHISLHGGLAGMKGEGRIPDSVTPAFGVGGGVRLFLSRFMAIDVDIREFFAKRTLAVNKDERAADPVFRPHTMVIVGLSFLLPPELETSP